MNQEAPKQSNGFRSFPCNLPIELLSYIFQFVCPAIDFRERPLCEDSSHDRLRLIYRNSFQYRYFPLVLGAVCCHWRNVAWSTPELWTTFALEVSTWALNSQIPLLRLYLTNVGSLLASLELSMRGQYMMQQMQGGERAALTMVPGLLPLANLLFDEFPNKLEVLRLADVPPTWMAYLSKEKMPMLRDLRIAWGRRFSEVITVDLEGGVFNASSAVDADGVVAIFKGRPPLPPLTTLHLQNVDPSLCAEVLYHMPFLVDFHCYLPIFLPSGTPRYTEGQFIPFQELLSLPNMKYFGWTATRSEPSSVNLLTNIRLPSLEEVQWSWHTRSMHNVSNEYTEAAIKFFSNLPATTQCFSFYGQTMEFSRKNSAEYRHHHSVFCAIPQIRSLIFNRCTSGFMESVFELLSSRVPNCLLPSMERVIIQDRIESGHDMKDAMVAFVKMVRARRSTLGIAGFTLEAVNCDLSWNIDAHQSLRDLSDDAFASHIHIIENSRERLND